jgi:hypothetical protein
MRRHLLGVLQQTTVLEIHRDPGCAERMAAELGLNPRRTRPAPNHAQRIGGDPHALVGKLANPIICLPAQQAISRISLQPASTRWKIPQNDLQAVTGRSLMAIPTLEASLDIPAGGELPLNAV